VKIWSPEGEVFGEITVKSMKEALGVELCMGRRITRWVQQKPEIHLRVLCDERGQTELA
jgi:hypothetical protein